MKEKRVVLRDVAIKAGVHLTTAARAMKNDPRVRPDTLERVQTIAKEMGYMPDPMLSALSTYRISSRPSLYHGTVAWITDFPEREGWRVESFNLYRLGAAEALARHGYLLEDFWLREPRMNGRRLAQILQSRGIRGVLVCPLPSTSGRISLSLENFAAVTFGYTLAKPAVHRVTTSHYENMQLCMRQLYQLGYRRPGFVIWDEISKRVHDQWMAAYRTPPFADRWDALPILQLLKKPTTFSEANREIFLKWVKTHRPDAVLVVDRHILDWLTEAGYRVPEDIAYVSPSLQESNVEHAGVFETSHDVGRAAGDFLAGMLARGEFGIPEVPRRILLDGFWQLGKTARTLVSNKVKTKDAAVSAELEIA
ncbi:MAG: LacI family DNA-binding transcriptional regulator [Rariglobus sp.]